MAAQVHFLDAEQLEKSAGKVLERIYLGAVAESYHFLKFFLRFTSDRTRTLYADWNKTDLHCKAFDSCIDVLGRIDDDGKPWLDRVLDRTHPNPTTFDFLKNACDSGLPVFVSASVFSSENRAYRINDRIGASAALPSPRNDPLRDGHSLAEDLRKALECTFAFAVDEVLGASLHIGSVQRLSVNRVSLISAWMQESLCSGKMLSEALNTCAHDADVKSLLTQGKYLDLFATNQTSWRKVVALSIEHGLALPIINASLSAYDALRTEKSQAGIIAACLDRTYGTGFERVDRPIGEIVSGGWD